MKEHRFRFWAPLTNFECEISKIELAVDLFLRKASEEEKGKMGRLIKEWPTITLGNFLLECFITKEKPEPWPGEYIEDARIYIEKAITILRLYKDESICYNLIVQPLAEGKTYGITASTMKHYQLWGKSPRYKIVNKEIDKLKTFFKEFDVDTFEPFSLAIHYFNKSYIEPYTPRDSFLDLMISLENLYLKGENLELGYKLRMRMAYILAKEIEKRKVIFEDVRKAYNYRGSIVHGETTPDISYEFFFKIREYTRESLKIFLKNPTLRVNLDGVVLKGNF